jgi:cytochrome c oxidase cbb3-type subunit I/II
MLAPDAVSANSIMPAYPWLFEQTLNKSEIIKKISALRKIGVPYPEGFENDALGELDSQAKQIADNLKGEGIEIDPDAEIIAMIAYLQRLGTDIKIK